ncbi:MAG: extracellular solute-binding protein [Nitrososphaeria archaeon]
MSSEPKRVDRRGFLYAGLGAVALIAVGAAAYIAMNPPVVTVTQSTTVPTTSLVTTTIPTTSVVTTTVSTTVITTSEIPVPPSIIKGTLKIPLHKPPWLPGLQTMIAMYESNHPDAKIELDLIADFITLRDKQITEAEQGLGLWDCYHLTNDMNPVIIGKHAYGINEIDPNYKMDPNVFVQEWLYDYDGVLRGFPLNLNNDLLYYREDLFNEKGLKVPETWEDVLEAAKALHDPSKPLYGFIPRCADDPGKEAYVMLRCYGGDLFVDWKNKDFTVRINDEHGLAAFEMFAELLKYAPPSPATLTQADMIAHMAAGTGAQALIVYAGTPWMDDPTFSKVPRKVNFKNPPAGTGLPGCRHAPVEMGWSTAISLKTKNKELAWDWLKFTISYEAQLAFAMAGVAPIRKDVASLPTLINDPKYRNLKAEGEAMKDTVYWPNIPEFPTLCNPIMKNFVQKIAVGKPVKDSLNELAEDIYNLMKSKGYKTNWTPNLWQG